MSMRAVPRIVQLKLATLALPNWHPEAERTPTCLVYGYAVDHPDGPIVFDTGVGVGNGVIDEFFDPDVLLLERALAVHGMDPTSVSAVVNSHLHFDHCGQNPAFYGTEVPFFIGRSEIESVVQDPDYTVAEWALPPEGQRNLVDRDLVIADGVTVLTAPGHTAGHLAMVVEAEAGKVVLAGQAVWGLAEFVDEIATPSNVSDEELRSVAVDTIRRLKSLGAPKRTPHDRSIDRPIGRAPDADPRGRCRLRLLRPWGSCRAAGAATAHPRHRSGDSRRRPH